MQVASSPVLERRLVWCVLAIALLIRLWGVDYGLPFVYWTDEYHEVMRAMELGAGGFNLARTGKGGFYLLLFLEYGFYFVGLKFSGIVTSTREFAELFVKDPTMFYLLGRVTAASFGAATVAFVYLLARSAFAVNVGIIAAAFIAVNTLHVDLSHRVGVDVPMALFAAMALYFGVRIANGGGRRDYVLAGLCAALATTTKLPGVIALLPLLVAHGYNASRSGESIRGWIGSGNAWAAFVVFLLVWIATNPGILIAENYIAVYEGGESNLGREAGENEYVEGAPRPNLWVFYLLVLQSSMGWPLFLLSGAGIVYGMWKRTPVDVMLLSYGVANYVAISGTTSESLYYPRYTLPIIVVLSVFSARALVSVLQNVKQRRNWLLVVSVILACAWPLLESLKFSYSLTQTDTRTEAKQWFDAHVPAGTKVMIEGGKITASRLTVPLQDSRDSLDRRMRYWENAEPRQARYLRVLKAVHPGGGYELELVRVGTIQSLDHYLDLGIEYFVIRPDTFVGARKAVGDSADFLDDLRLHPGVRLVERFEAGDELRQGPPIEIYRVDSDFRQVN